MKINYTFNPKPIRYNLLYTTPKGDRISFLWNPAIDGPIEKFKNVNDCEIVPIYENKV